MDSIKELNSRYALSEMWLRSGHFRFIALRSSNWQLQLLVDKALERRRHLKGSDGAAQGGVENVPHKMTSDLSGGQRPQWSKIFIEKSLLYKFMLLEYWGYMRLINIRLCKTYNFNKAFCRGGCKHFTSLRGGGLRAVEVKIQGHGIGFWIF